MPFGLTNAPSIFQSFISEIFADMLDNTVLIYINDIMVFTKDVESHKRALGEILKRLKKNSLYVNPEKSEFYKKEVIFLGYNISNNKISADKTKISALQTWERHKNTRQLQQFIGFVNYYRRFASNFTKRAENLYNLLKNLTGNQKTRSRKVLEWTEEHTESFNNIRKELEKNFFLKQPGDGDKLQIETDASNSSIASVVSKIVEENGKRTVKPIAFFSRILKKSKTNYPVHEKELLSIVETFKKFRHWFSNKDETIVKTDNKSLEFLNSFLSSNSGRLA
jgi:RNase H-like domain found in reverse transcriptase/Reverse transcriptase (RNA-dependent DNA polymerase)